MKFGAILQVFQALFEKQVAWMTFWTFWMFYCIVGAILRALLDVLQRDSIDLIYHYLKACGKDFRERAPRSKGGWKHIYTYLERATDDEVTSKVLPMIMIMIMIIIFHTNEGKEA